MQILPSKDANSAVITGQASSCGARPSALDNTVDVDAITLSTTARTSSELSSIIALTAVDLLPSERTVNDRWAATRWTVMRAPLSRHRCCEGRGGAELLYTGCTRPTF